MKATILDNGNLEISVDTDEQAELRLAKEENEDFDSDAFMYDFLEPLICNSEYMWMLPEHCGALTDAPMLGVYGEDTPLTDDVSTDYVRVTGSDGKNTFYSPVEQAWAFMDYQIISVQQRLLDEGKAIFIKG